MSGCLGYELVENHCFVDGSKRIALMAAYPFWLSNVLKGGLAQ
jgi:prophage maintenance system killer protein